MLSHVSFIHYGTVVNILVLLYLSNVELLINNLCLCTANIITKSSTRIEFLGLKLNIPCKNIFFMNEEENEKYVVLQRLYTTRRI